MLQENLHWNGITSKKKGQKWGIEKAASYKRNEWTSLNQESSEMLVAEKATIANNPIDFDKLTPYTSFPNVRFFHTSIIFLAFFCAFNDISITYLKNCLCLHGSFFLPITQ
jgi:hypothetical protein